MKLGSEVAQNASGQLLVVLAHFGRFVDGVFAMTEEVQRAVVERPIFGVQRIETKGNVRMPKERCGFFHDAAQGIEVEGIELAVPGLRCQLQLGE